MGFVFTWRRRGSVGRLRGLGPGPQALVPLRQALALALVFPRQALALVVLRREGVGSHRHHPPPRPPRRHPPKKA